MIKLLGMYFVVTMPSILCIPCVVQEKPIPQVEREVESLIDSLTTRAQLGTSYDPAAFVVNDCFRATGDDVVGDFDTLNKIVGAGPSAVRVLCRHLNDERPLAVPDQMQNWKKYGFVAAMSYDRNPMNSSLPKDLSVPQSSFEAPLTRIDRRSVRVGEVCFVALGFIVNRKFISHQLVGGNTTYVVSPIDSPLLAELCCEEWESKTEAEIIESLRSDFLNPDSFKRRYGAYKRLCRFAPYEMERTVVEALDQWELGFHIRRYDREYSAWLGDLTDDQSSVVETKLLACLERHEDGDWVTNELVTALAHRPNASARLIQHIQKRLNGPSGDLHAGVISVLTRNPSESMYKFLKELAFSTDVAEHFIAICTSIREQDRDAYTRRMMEFFQSELMKKEKCSIDLIANGLTFAFQGSKRECIDAFRLVDRLAQPDLLEQIYITMSHYRRENLEPRLEERLEELTRTIVIQHLDDKRVVRDRTRVCDLAASYLVESKSKLILKGDENLYFDLSRRAKEKDKQILELKKRILFPKN